MTKSRYVYYKDLREGSEIGRFSFFLNVTSNFWKAFSVEDFLEYQRIVLSYMRNGYQGVGVVIPNHLVPLWNVCKERIDHEIKCIYEHL